MRPRRAMRSRHAGVAALPHERAGAPGAPVRHAGATWQVWCGCCWAGARFGARHACFVAFALFAANKCRAATPRWCTATALSSYQICWPRWWRCVARACRSAWREWARASGKPGRRITHFSRVHAARVARRGQRHAGAHFHQQTSAAALRGRTAVGRHAKCCRYALPMSVAGRAAPHG